ncbi:MAG: hypothetical protein U5R06_06110 [candidate division KSB1 bacterium]|nr:hypothetical protein [candidate division KSB1 bacterium]
MQKTRKAGPTMQECLQIISFGNTDKQKLKKFVDFHWTLYKDDPQYVPLLNYEYLGFGLIGMTGFFEPKNPFFEHAEIQFFLAEKNNKIVGRCYAFINYNHNKHWDDRTGFFGGFESVDDPVVAKTLLQHAEEWLGNKGMDTLRGPQHLPVNEATPGCLVDGFDSRPVLYYHYNKPYYADLLKDAGLEKVKGILSWEIPVMNEMEDKLKRVAEKVIDRFDLTFEHWDERPLSIRKQEMLDIYNDAWSDNFGFVPFTRKEFYAIVNDMMLIMEKNLFMFIYVNGEPAAFFGGVLNVAERMVPIKWCTSLRIAARFENDPEQK